MNLEFEQSALSTSSLPLVTRMENPRQIRSNWMRYLSLSLLLLVSCQLPTIDCVIVETDTDTDTDIDPEALDSDGDGLRDIWDVHPWSIEYVRGPLCGLERRGLGEGDQVITELERIVDEFTVLSGGAVAGSTILQVEDAEIFDYGQEIVLYSQQGPDAGQFAFLFVVEGAGGELTVEPALTQTFSESSVVLVQHVPHYGDVQILSGGQISTLPWQGAGGGLVAFRACGEVLMQGTITAEYAGFRGGSGVINDQGEPTQGESITGPGQANEEDENLGGGGAGLSTNDSGLSGGGGAHVGRGNLGSGVDGSLGGRGGVAYGATDTSVWYMGSGGGGGGADLNTPDATAFSGRGGNGGGVIAIFSDEGINIAFGGGITVNGEPGQPGNAASATVGGGGGGAGGTIHLTAPEVILDEAALLDYFGFGGGNGVEGGFVSTDGVGGNGGVGFFALNADEFQTPSGGEVDDPLPDARAEYEPDPTPEPDTSTDTDPVMTEKICNDPFVQGGPYSGCSVAATGLGGLSTGFALLAVLFGRRRRAFGAD